MSHFIKLQLLFTLAIISLGGCLQESSTAPAEIMYFILIDRFVDGDPSNNQGNHPASFLPFDGQNYEALKHYQGGDLQGVTMSLDSLQSLGVTMLWLSPFIDNSDTDYVGWWAYHGYHPIDFYQVDEHFGTLEDLIDLVDAAHLRGMQVIFDMPFNQTAADHPWVHDSERQSWFHRDAHGQPYEISDWQDQVQIERGELHGLPDLAQEVPAVRDYLFEVSKYWIETTGCDGFRLDAVKHIPRSFWEDYTQRIRALAGDDFLLLGEVFWGEAWRIEPYDDLGFDYLFDIPGYYAIRNTFNKGAGMGAFSNFYELNRQSINQTAMATLIDNHDVARFNVGLESLAWERQLLALGWLMTSPGLPVIYSGTEIGMQGYPVEGVDGQPQDFLNRLPYPRIFSEEQRSRKAEFARLTALRSQFPALGAGSFNEVYKDWSTYAYLRSLKDEHILVCLNNASTQEFVSIPLPATLSIESSELLYGQATLRHESNELLLRLPAYSLSVWQVQGEVKPTTQRQVSFTDRYSLDYRRQLLFYVDPTRQVESLQVAGDFNNWVATTYPTQWSGDSLKIEVPIKPGKYLYKLVLDETMWIADPEASEFSTDPYGGQNSILVVD